jgi:hypothetical protein
VTHTAIAFPVSWLIVKTDNLGQSCMKFSLWVSPRTGMSAVQYRASVTFLPAQIKQ